MGGCRGKPGSPDLIASYAVGLEVFFGGFDFFFWGGEVVIWGFFVWFVLVLFFV